MEPIAVGTNCAGSTGRNSPLSTPSCSSAEHAHADRQHVLGKNAVQVRLAAAAGAHQLAHEDARMMRRRGNGIEVLAGVVQKAFARGPGRSQTSMMRWCRGAKKFSSVAPYKRFLVVKVVVEQRLVDAGGFGDGVDARAGQAFLGELGQRGLEDGVAAGLRLAAAAAARFGGFELRGIFN